MMFMEGMQLDEAMEPVNITETGEGVEAGIDYDGIGEKMVDAEVRTDVENFEGEDVIVIGNPFEVAENLDYKQGDNPYGARGDCGLTSCSNFLNLCGIEATEDDVVGFALENGLCANNPFASPEHVGGTNDAQLETILECYGVESSVYYPDDSRGSLEGIASAVEEGHAVMMGVNAGYLWDEPAYVDGGDVNHQITVTGAIRDTEGEVVGLTICDSGRGLEEDSCRVLSISELQDCYATAGGASVIISDEVVR